MVRSFGGFFSAFSVAFLSRVVLGLYISFTCSGVQLGDYNDPIPIFNTISRGNCQNIGSDKFNFKHFELFIPLVKLGLNKISFETFV